MRSRGSAVGAPCAWLDAADRARRLRPWLRPRHGAAMRREVSLNTKEPDGPSLCDDCPPVNYPTDKTRCGPCPRRKGETACLSAVATNEPCLPDSTLKRCTICGFIVDTQYAAELPPRNAAASAQSETKEPSAKPAAAGDLERARALLADDPDEMDEEWLAGIITAIRAEARAGILPRNWRKR